MKLMYAAWGDGRTGPLSSQGLRAELKAAGVHRLQVNVADEHVAAARLRLSTFSEPVSTVVSAWTDAGADAVTGRLAAWSTRLLGWVVEETCPLPPPHTEDGRRADALANVALLRIPPGMSPHVWRERWQDRHTRVALETQATRGYVQNRVVEALTDEENPVAALVEELFSMAAMTDLHAFYDSGGEDAELRRRVTRMMESTATFGASTNLDLIPTSRYLWNYR